MPKKGTTTGGTNDEGVSRGSVLSQKKYENQVSQIVYKTVFAIQHYIIYSLIHFYTIALLRWIYLQWAIPAID
jgi:hypothetical protein